MIPSFRVVAKCAVRDENGKPLRNLTPGEIVSDIDEDECRRLLKAQCLVPVKELWAEREVFEPPENQMRRGRRAKTK